MRETRVKVVQVPVSETELSELDALATIERVSRAELSRRAVRFYAAIQRGESVLVPFGNGTRRGE